MVSFQNSYVETMAKTINSPAVYYIPRYIIYYYTCIVDSPNSRIWRTGGGSDDTRGNTNTKRDFRRVTTYFRRATPKSPPNDETISYYLYFIYYIMITIR